METQRKQDGAENGRSDPTAAPRGVPGVLPGGDRVRKDVLAILPASAAHGVEARVVRHQAAVTPRAAVAIHESVVFPLSFRLSLP